MGGHTQLGEFLTLDLAVKAFKVCVEKYADKLHLFLQYAEIIYDDKDKKYKLAMRFSK